MYRRRVGFGDVLAAVLTAFAFAFGAAGIIIAVASVLVYMPVGLLTEAECLERGYPNSTITYKLDRYCMNLEGTVTVKVDELTKEKEDE